MLGGSGLRLRFRRWLPTQTTARLRSPERQADSIAECDDLGKAERRWLVVTEFQSRPEKGKLLTLLEECGIFANRLQWEGGGYAVMPAWAHLTGDPEAAVVDMRSPSGCGLFCAPSPWEIAKDDAAAELERVVAGTRSWSLLAWVPLMAGADSDIIVTRWNEVLEAVVKDERRKRDIKSVAMTLS
ncbi:MAG: hypothetical protein K2W96_18200, partial [Gemmataceae bacterium]|nr:hypothetical protein [Gemmataceae bacterium]